VNEDIATSVFQVNEDIATSVFQVNEDIATSVFQVNEDIVTSVFQVNEDIVAKCGKMQVLDKMLSQLRQRGHKVWLILQCLAI